MISKYKNKESFIVDGNFYGFGFYLANQYPNLAREVYKKAIYFEKNIGNDIDLIYTVSLLSDEEINKYFQNLKEDYALEYIDLLTRESIFEVYRRLYNIDLNSRYNSLFLTDKESIDYWKEILEDHDLYELEVSGNYYKTSGDLLSKSCLLPYYVHECAKNYWNNDLNSDSNEYLFKGNVKVLRKVN